MLPILAMILALVLPAILLAAAVRDATSFTIPNWMSLTLLAVFPLAGLAAGLPPEVLLAHAGAGAAALVLGMALFALRLLGGGDAKLFAATALWMGWGAAGPFLLATLLAGGALSVGLILLRAPLLRPYVLSGPAWFVRLAEPKEAVPYGLAIAAGALTAFPESPFMAVFAAL
ncbi:prepilin peptidase [Phenylobacterium sp.]|uniref:A24 family peptidase n=1 Tax=Phenylobacterium sp. TaxID=1871053 RepID=UPI00391B1799